MMIGTAAARRPLLLLDFAMKAATVCALVTALVWPNLPQWNGQDMVWRALTYPSSLIVVLACWSIFGRARQEAYPYGLDTLLPLPLLVDAAAPRLYHSVAWWDKFMHVVSWSVLGAATVLFLSWFRLDRVVIAGLAVGIGWLAALLWELGEYLVWVRHSPELLMTAYSDTIGDLICGLSATVIAVALTLLLATRRERQMLERLRLDGAATVETIGSNLREFGMT
jgi:hypothetical protein